MYLQDSNQDVPWFNYLQGYNLNEHDVRKAHDFFKGKSFKWCIYNNDEETLQTVNPEIYLLEDFFYEMMLDIPTFKRDHPLRQDLTCISITTEEELAIWCSLVACAFKAPYEKIYQYHNALFHCNNKNIFWLLGFYQETPVAALLVILHPNSLGLHYGAVDHRYQKHGFGAEIIAQALHREYPFNPPYVVARTGSKGKKWCEKIGFTVVNEGFSYLYLSKDMKSYLQTKHTT